MGRRNSYNTDVYVLVKDPKTRKENMLRAIQDVQNL